VEESNIGVNNTGHHVEPFDMGGAEEHVGCFQQVISFISSCFGL